MTGIDQIAGALQAASQAASQVTSQANQAAFTGGANAFGTDAVPFAGVLQAMVEQSSALSKKATDAVTGMMNGKGVEVHEAMIATQKADMAFELALQVRNKAVGAYQQMMSMQF